MAAKSQSVSTPSSNQGAMVVPNSGELNNTPCHSISNLQPLDTIHCIKLFDTDTLEELWSEDTAHHGAIYELQWSKNDRYLLSSSSDGTSKVWDLITFVYRIILPNGVPSTNGNSDGNLSPFVSGEQFNFSVVQNNGVSVMETVKNFNASYSNNMIAALDLMGTITLAAVLRNTPPVHVYTSIFQEFNAISRPPKNIPEKIQEDGEEPNEILNKLQEIADAPLPRIITGASDGRIRVWDGETFEGFITVRRKNKPEDLMDDFQPHNGAINSITIDGRSK